MRYTAHLKHCDCRKPKVGLALKAKTDFPEIEFRKSIILGDSISDIEFGKSLGMITVFINQNRDFSSNLADLCFKNILEFALAVSKKE
jgi:D-glycero-D-manno-heptose 1,7-bisphosphate phosphatase